MNKVSEPQKRASRKYEDRRTARVFVKSYATEEDMQELIKIYSENKDNRV